MPVRQRTETAIGLDVGGTRIRAGRIDASGQILDRIIEPVDQSRAGFVSQVLRLISTIRRPSDCAVGAGLPGRVRARTNSIISAGYLDIAGVDLTEEIARVTGLTARLENDAMMALLAEVHVAPVVNEDLILMVTVGTGIGGAISKGGRPWHGGDFAGSSGISWCQRLAPSAIADEQGVSRPSVPERLWPGLFGRPVCQSTRNLRCCSI